MPIDDGGAIAATARAARCLAAHPWIDVAHVEPGGVVLTPAKDALSVRPSLGSLMQEHLRHWGDIYDSVYAAETHGRTPDLDIAGWRRSDTGAAFDAEHMRDWADQAAALALRDRPRWVLEIGCGTGLLAQRLRGRVGGYVGTDVVPSVLASLAAGGDGRTAFVSAAAHEVDGDPVRRALDAVGCPADGPDCVLLNSVVQYFPNLEYLGVVLRAAVGLVAPGGRIVVGDLRHAGLFARFCQWVERGVDPSADPAQIAGRARARADREPELLIDPVRLARLLCDIAAETGRQVSMAVHPKLLRADTELARYRFDTVLLIDQPGNLSEPPVVEWEQIGSSPIRLEALADRVTRGPTRIAGIPNRLLVTVPDAATAYQLGQAVRGTDATVVLDPGDPDMLGVVCPAAAAARPVARIAASGPGAAYEPFEFFVRRMLLQAARRVLRAERLEGLDVSVAVGVPPGRSEPDRNPSGEGW